MRKEERKKKHTKSPILGGNTKGMLFKNWYDFVGQMERKGKNLFVLKEKPEHV